MIGTSFQLQSTRQNILAYLRRNGRATVKDLGESLGLTSTGIRQHLTVLERDGLVEAREERGRVGRPTLMYSLTPAADSLVPKSYDILARALLNEIRASEGNEKFHQMLHRVAYRLASSHLDRVDGRTPDERVAEASRIMAEMGSLVEWRMVDDDYLIDEFTCPFMSVAAKDRAVCALHVEFVRNLTGADTKLVHSLLRGERACTYRLRGTAKTASDV